MTSVNLNILTPKVEVETWAEYPEGTNMAAAVEEQRQLGHPVLEVKGTSVLIAVGDNTPQQEQRAEEFLRAVHVPKASLWRP